MTSIFIQVEDTITSNIFSGRSSVDLLKVMLQFLIQYNVDMGHGDETNASVCLFVCLFFH